MMKKRRNELGFGFNRVVQLDAFEINGISEKSKRYLCSQCTKVNGFSMSKIREDFVQKDYCNTMQL